MKAIIAGAGRGIRMMPLTESLPKCMMEGINGQRVMDWILDSLNESGIQDVVFVGGYKMDTVVQAYPHMRFYENKQWAHNNVLASLMFAENEMNTEFVASYSDILYGKKVVKQLLASNAEIAVVTDRNWRKRYVDRTLKSEDRAEKVMVEDGRIVKIGMDITADKAYGEFIGLVKFNRQAACRMRKRYHELQTNHSEISFHSAPCVQMAYLTDMIQELIDMGIWAEPVDIWADWAELDTLQDLEWARTKLNGKGTAGLTREFWALRAQGYQRLDWTNRKGYLDSFVAAGDFQAHDCVLDIGTGTGIVAHAVAPLVSEVVGIDLSPEMREHAYSSCAANEIFESGDVRQLQYADNRFHKVTARMVFHHLIDGADVAMRECFRVLRPGGLMLLSEGVPPDKSLAKWYSSMFALKEVRLTFFEEDLVSLMKQGGFVVEQVVEHISPQVSICNWLRNSGLPQKRQDMIMQLHLDLNEEGKKFYNMTVTENDIFCDFKFLIVTGRKPSY